MDFENGHDAGKPPFKHRDSAFLIVEVYPAAFSARIKYDPGTSI